jgi:hypothetical protein
MTLNGDTGAVVATVIVIELIIWSWSSDETIKLWNQSTGVWERTKVYAGY